MIRTKDYFTSSGKYPEREHSPEITESIRDSVEELLDRVNLLLEEIGVKDADVRSGFRPTAVNSSIVGAAKKSTHLTGQGIDISDNDGEIKKKITIKLLEEHDLYMEHPDNTLTWCHLQSRRVGSGNRIFKPI